MSPTRRSRSSGASPSVLWCGSLPDVDIPFDRRREQEYQAQRPLWGQVQVSPASVVAELNAVVGVALEAADDDDAISLTVLGTPVCQHGAKLRVALFHVLYLLVIIATPGFVLGSHCVRGRALGCASCGQPAHNANHPALSPGLP